MLLLQGIELGTGIEIVDPVKVREEYVARLVELRKSKGMTEVVAREQLEDNVVLGTLMLERRSGWPSFWCCSYDGKYYPSTVAIN